MHIIAAALFLLISQPDGLANSREITQQCDDNIVKKVISDAKKNGIDLSGYDIYVDHEENGSSTVTFRRSKIEKDGKIYNVYGRNSCIIYNYNNGLIEKRECLEK